MIPRTLHVVWIGSPVPPLVRHCIDSWREKHPDWKHKLWTNERGWKNQHVIDALPEWNGKADVMRWEILANEGGVCVDADSECVRTLDDSLLQYDAVACFENEVCRPGLIACGFLAGAPGNAFWKACVEDAAHADTRQPAWFCVGPGLITRAAQRMPGALHVLPARSFIPHHFSGVDAPGDATIYARQLWGSTFGYKNLAALAPAAEPLVSVVIPCFKQAQYLGDAVASVQAQTYKNVQIIVAAGDEDSYATAKKLNVHVTRDGGKNQANARNMGISEADGNYILPLDADDMIAPDFLAKAVPLASEDTIVGTQMYTFGSQHGVVALPPYDRSTLLECNPLFVCSLYSKKLWEQVGGYNVATFYEDWSFWISCLKSGAHVAVVPEPLFRYRIHADNRTHFCMKHDETLRAMIRLVHPDLVDNGRRAVDLAMVLAMPSEVREIVEKRRAAFPDNELLRSWTA